MGRGIIIGEEEGKYKKAKEADKKKSEESKIDSKIMKCEGK